MNKIFLPCLAALALSACNAETSQPPLTDAPLAGAAIGGPFTLIDQDGKQRSYDEFQGKYRLVYFGYTQCPDICTPDMQNMMAGLKAFEKANPELGAKVQPLFITVDAKRDTPAVLKQFVSSFHPRLIGLTGSEEQIAAATKSFAIYAAQVEGSSPENYLMSHSQTPYLMGPDGKPLALIPADTPNSEANEGAPELVAAELAKWVR
jgi:protein SCO1/2